MLNSKKVAISLVLLVVVVFSFYFASNFRQKYVLTQELHHNMLVLRSNIKIYVERYSEYPVLKNDQIDFWDVQTNQLVWLNSFEGLANIATNPVANLIKQNVWKVYDKDLSTMRAPNEKDLESYSNPITGKFDWLAEDASGTLYSPDMPDSVLIASPPIRVVNIRCPLTASDPPFYEDFTKW